MGNFLALSAGATNAIIISVTCACIALLFFMLVYRKRKSIQQAHDGSNPTPNKEKHKKHKKVKELEQPSEDESHKDMLSDIIAVHEQKQAEAQESKAETEEEPKEVDIKEVEDISADNSEE